MAGSGASCNAASRLTYVGPHGGVCAIWKARSSASQAAGMDAGWLSHLVKSRTSAPWSEAVWIQSIHGLRRAASIGPVAPSSSIGTRSHHALKIAIEPCISPTFECSTAPIGLPVTLA